MFHIVEVVLKWLLKALLVVAILGLLLWGGVAAYSYFSYERHIEKVDIAVSVHPEGAGAICSDMPGLPLFVDIINNSSKTVEEVRFILEARRKGHSANLASNRAYESSKLLKPGQVWGDCLPAAIKDDVTVDPLGLDWSVGGRIDTFE